MKLGIVFLVIGIGDIYLTTILVGSFGSVPLRLLIDLAFIGIGVYRLWRWSRKRSRKQDKIG